MYRDAVEILAVEADAAVVVVGQGGGGVEVVSGGGGGGERVEVVVRGVRGGVMAGTLIPLRISL